MMELLSPAGGMEQLRAAARFGADAVYGGLKKFGLRAAAGNFDWDELQTALDLLHGQGKKFYLTLNILPYDDELAELGQSARRAAQMGVDAAIVGSPNVGKSTLLNLLAGFDRAIVTPIAGTTRDVVEQAVMLGGVRVTLRDTAGLRDTGDVVEEEGIRRSRRAMEEAGLILAVFDGSAPLTEEDKQLAADCAGRPAIAIVNKSDLPQQFDPAAIAASFAEVVTLAAGRGEGAQALGEAVRRVLGVANLDPSAPCLVSQRQYAAACEGRAALEEAENALAGGFGLDAVSVCVDDALSALCRLTGEDASEAVVEEVFSTFCVGK